MLFARSYRLTSGNSVEAIKEALLGKIFTIRNMKFEVYEGDKHIKIIPHSEDNRDSGTLPITHLNLEGRGDTTNLNVSYKIRKLDQGGPYLLVIFCIFLLLGSLAFFYFHENILGFVFLALSFIIFAGFWVKMQSGYFDYAAKIKKHIKERISAN